MGKFEKAVNFYLRGFNSQYIKRRTGISMQSIIKQLKEKGVTYTKGDIVSYQIAYISEKYTTADIEEAYRIMMARYDDPYKIAKSRRVQLLGCGFGDFPRVLSALLGNEKYRQLQKECEIR